jgi:hypothetical protein
VHDIVTKTNQPIIKIRSGTQEQRFKTVNAERDIPIPPRPIQLGFLEDVQQIKCTQAANSLWPDLPKRNERGGGYFSPWFGENLKSLQLNGEVDFQSFSTFR